VLSSLLGVVLAFATIMLVLSLVVMGLVQLTQAVLRLRARNLIVGVAALLRAEGVAPPKREFKASLLRPRADARHAADVLNQTTAAKLRPVRRPNSWAHVFRGPAVSWVDPTDLGRVLQGAQPQPSAAPDAVSVQPVPPSESAAAASPSVQTAKEGENQWAAKFRALEPAMTDRFARTMQFYTSVWAVVVAIAFQVSTPALIRMLSTSDAKREAVIAMVPAVLKQAESTIPSAMDNDFVDRAVAQLLALYPDKKDLFDQLSGSTDSREEMLAEMRDVLGDDPQSDEITARYAQIIDSNAVHDVTTAITTTAATIDSLDALDIRLWGEGIGFYRQPVNVIGVLVTALLLSFGAPFWFQQVKNIASLRDALSTRKESSS
jgi:hypothetical protein